MKAILLVIALAFNASLASAAVPQTLKNFVQPYQWKSGPVENKSSQWAVVARHKIQVPEALGLRLHFERNPLPSGVVLRFTTRLGRNAQQTYQMNETILKAYYYTTPYLNGQELTLEILVAPGTQYSGLAIKGYEAPRRIPVSTESICGDDDDRIPSQAKQIARMMELATGDGGCTGTLIGLSCMVSAGHCVDYLNIAQFNVPMSSAGGKANFPPPEHQYPLATQIAHEDGGPGKDWAVYRVQPNPNTKVLAGAAQGFLKIAPVTPKPGDILRITGYGSALKEKNFAQQTHTGVVVEIQGSALKYAVDTMPGNSGSSVVLESTQEIIGIHTHGGCTGSAGSANAGTLLAKKPDFQKAVQQCLQADTQLLEAMKKGARP